MAQQLGTFAEDPNLLPINYPHGSSQLSVTPVPGGSDTVFWPHMQTGAPTCVSVHTHTQEQTNKNHLKGGGVCL